MTNQLASALASAAFLCSAIVNAQTTPAILTPGQPIAIPGASGHFDYMTADPSTGRIFASHPGAKELSILDVKTNVASQINLQTEVNGVAVDAEDHKFFTAGGGGVVFDLDRGTLKVNTQVTLDGPGDSITFDPDNDTLYIDNDDGTKIWALDAKTDKVTAAITIDGAPEYMAYDPATKRLFQNIKADDEVSVIDTTTNKVTSSWPTAPALKPHGLVFDTVSNKLFSAGKNKTLVEIDAATGKVVGSVALASATDQIAFDAKSRRIYAPGGGFITVIGIAADGTPTVLGQATIPPSAHTLAVDPTTGTVWITYSDTTQSYFQPYTPSKSS